MCCRVFNRHTGIYYFERTFNTIMYNSLIYYGCGVLLTLALPCSGFYMIDRKKDKEWENSIWSKCNKYCRYGYATDVEGNYICKCNDPCANVFCLGGTTCVVIQNGPCDWISCAPQAECTDAPIQLGKDKNDYQSLLLNIPQQDAAAENQATDDLCRLPPPPAAFMDCKKKRRKWFFDIKTGRCVRYKGCETVGNSFSRKRDCKQKCMRSRRRKTGRRKGHRRSKAS